MPKEIESETIFGTTMFWPKKINGRKGPPRSQQNLDVALILSKDQP